MAAARLLIRSGELLQPLWRWPPLGEPGVILQEEHCRVVDGLVVHFLPVGKGSCSGQGTDLGLLTQPASQTWLPPLLPGHLLLADVLGATAVLVLKGRQDQLVAFEAALLHSGERWCWGLPPLRDEHNEGQGFW